MFETGSMRGVLAVERGDMGPGFESQILQIPQTSVTENSEKGQNS